LATFEKIVDLLVQVYRPIAGSCAPHRWARSSEFSVELYCPEDLPFPDTQTAQLVRQRLVLGRKETWRFSLPLSGLVLGNSFSRELWIVCAMWLTVRT